MTDPDAGPPGFLHELKRRRVVRVALIYVAAVFVALQGADLLIPALRLPDWIMTALVALATIALPVVLGLSWAFDVTPGGVRRADPNPPATRSPGWASRPRAVTSQGIVVAAAVFIVAGASGAFFVTRGADDPEASSRVVVMPFENRSANADLDPLGAMVADWVAQGLTETGLLAVLDTRSALAAADALGAAATPIAVGREVGAGVVVSGSYFLQGDSLQFQASVASAADGDILFGIADVSAPRDRPLDGVEQLRQRILAALASKHDRDVTAFNTVLSQPPTYAAYREFTEGLDVYLRWDLREAAHRFERAAALDSTFLVARLWAAQSWLFGGGDQPRGHALLMALKPLRHRLNRLDRARYDFVMALAVERDVGRAYEAVSSMLEAAPASVDARREMALSASRVLRPREAIERLVELDPRRGLLRNWLEYWSVLAWSHHLLGEHDQELAVARRGREFYPLDERIQFVELRALAALGRTSEVDSLARAYFRGSGAFAPTALMIAGELMAHGQAGSVHSFVVDAAELLDDHRPSPHAPEEWLRQNWVTLSEVGSVDFWSYLAPDSKRSLSPSERAIDEWLHQRTELSLLLGDMPSADEYASQVREPAEHGLLLARVSAGLGRPEAARAMLREGERRYLERSGTLRGLELDRAAVFVRLGEPERALEVLAESFARGALMVSVWGTDGHAHPDLAPLWNDPRFKALIEPRG